MYCPKHLSMSALLSSARHCPARSSSALAGSAASSWSTDCWAMTSGRIYAKRYFPPEAKAEAQAMVANIIAAFRKRIDALAWMDPATKAEAQAKLNTLYVGIGYPETWHDYSAYEVKPDDMFGNIWRGNLLNINAQVARLGKPIDRHEWSMTPQTVNAVNLPLQNALNFPAAILQPPFFDPQAPAAAQLRRDRLRHRTRNQPHLRHRGQHLRLQGPRAQLVDSGRLKHFEAATAGLPRNTTLTSHSLIFQ